MKNHKEEMPVEQQKNAIHHSTTNIIRAIVLLKRADNTLGFASMSLDNTGLYLMREDIEKSKRSIEHTIQNLEKYKG